MHRPSTTLTLDDRLRHVLVVGKTGMGKSTFLRGLVAEDLRAGHGLLLVDPHGDLANQVQGDLPRRRRNDLVPFDATRPDSCPGLNPLRIAETHLRPLAVSNTLATMRKLWPEFWGPRTEHVLRHVLLAVTEVRGATLEDAAAMLVDDKHRRWVLKQVKDNHVLSFWVREFPGYTKQLAADAAAAPLNKLGALLSSPVVRTIVTRSRPLLDARKAMDRSRVVIASLPKGTIGEDAALLLGGLLLGAFQHAAVGRATIALEHRRPFFLAIDEATSFASGPFLGMIAEARKFGVGLVLATQSLAVLEPDVRAALLGNVGTLVVFRVGGDDAVILGREFGGDYGSDNLMRLDVGEMVVRVGATPPVLVTHVP